MAISDTDRKRIQVWCDTNTPPEYADQMRVEARFRGNSVNILELRPPWREDFGPEWSERRVAKLSYDATARSLALFATDRNDRLLHYSDDFELSAKLIALLDEIDKDPTAIFWG